MLMLRQLRWLSRLVLCALGAVLLMIVLIYITQRSPARPIITPSPVALTQQSAYYVKSDAPVEGYACPSIDCEVTVLFPGGSAVTVRGDAQGEAMLPVQYGSTVVYVVENWLSPRPVAVGNPGRARGGATASCADGWVSYSQHRSGTCSHHGGVSRWYHHSKR